MKSKKYIAVIALMLVCIMLCSLFAACELFGGETEEKPEGNDSDISNNENNNSQSSEGSIDDGSDDEPFSPLDPDFKPDINESYIIDPIINNAYDGINRYIGEYAFSAPETIAVPDNRAVKDVVGAANYYGKYNFTQLPYLIEGAEMTAKDLGSSVYRFAMGPAYKEIYQFNHNWSDVTSLKELAQTSDYSKVFSNPDLKTFIISTEEFNTCEYYKVATENKDYNYFHQQYINVTNEFYDLAKYLLQTYRNEDKTFILSTVDGDEVFQKLYAQCTIGDGRTQKQALVETYYRYLNARQDGINKAVAEVSSSKAKVYGCVEVNYISSDIYGVSSDARLVDLVLPYTYSDLYSFDDAYTVLGYKDLTNELNYLLSKIPNPNKDFQGKKNIILGGVSYAANIEGESGQLNAVASTIIQAIEWGVQHVVYDSYCCSTRTDTSLEDRPTNGNMEGCWLICPDGSYAPIFWYLKGLNDGKNYLDKVPQLRLAIIAN